LPQSYILVCVNNAGRTAHQLGLKPADITIRAQRKAWDHIAGLSSGGVIWISKRSLIRERLGHPASWRHRARSWIGMTEQQRQEILVAMLGSPASPEGLALPTNGVFAIAYALAHGATRVIVSGLSLTENGHSYDGLNDVRRQVEPDRAAFAVIRERKLPVVTSEPDLARETGLQLLS
jgi:hypothetical protein